MIALFAAAALAAAPTGHRVVVSDLNTPDLAENCARPDRELMATDFCTGYLLGVFDRLSVSGGICPGVSAAAASAVGVGRKYLADHPSEWGKPPSVILSSAFQAAYPCRR